MKTLPWLPLMLCLLALPVAAQPAPATRVADKPVATQEAAQRAKLQQAQQLIADGKSSDAIVLIDQVLAYYVARYPEGETRWYVARTPEETLYYMADAALQSDAHPGKRNASSLVVAWADAWFLKGYAWNELGRPDDAKLALEQAVRLSPQNATYLIELAEANKLERNWDECLRLYGEAEAAAEFSSPDQRLADLGQAKRGQAFVFIEQHKFEQAEALLKECLKLNASDARAREELDYIAKLRKQDGPAQKN